MSGHNCTELQRGLHMIKRMTTDITKSKYSSMNQSLYHSTSISYPSCARLCVHMAECVDPGAIKLAYTHSINNMKFAWSPHSQCLEDSRRSKPVSPDAPRMKVELHTVIYLLLVRLQAAEKRVDVLVLAVAKHCGHELFVDRSAWCRVVTVAV